MYVYVYVMIVMIDVNGNWLNDCDEIDTEFIIFLSILVFLWHFGSFDDIISVFDDVRIMMTEMRG